MSDSAAQKARWAARKATKRDESKPTWIIRHAREAVIDPRTLQVIRHAASAIGERSIPWTTVKGKARKTSTYRAQRRAAEREQIKAEKAEARELRRAA